MEVINIELSISYKYLDDVFVKVYNGENNILDNLFYRELKINEYLENENISPKIKKIYISKNFKKIYFNRIYGKDLSKINFSNYSLKEKLLFFLKILNSFEKLHSLGIIHNDINLKNMIYCDEKIYIIDFADSKFIDEICKEKNYYIYTNNYSALEKYSKYNKDFIQNDTYSLTAILYYLIFQKEFVSICDSRYFEIIFFNKEIERFLKKGLKINIHKRFKNILEMKKWIEVIIEKI